MRDESEVRGMDISDVAGKTWWISILGTLLVSWLGGAIAVLAGGTRNGGTFGDLLLEAFVGTLLLLLVYGSYIWLIWAFLILALDSYLFKPPAENIRAVLLFEWGASSVVLGCLTIGSPDWGLLVPVVGLLLSQLYRERRMKGILARDAELAASIGWDGRS